MQYDIDNLEERWFQLVAKPSYPKKISKRETVNYNYWVELSSRSNLSINMLALFAQSYIAFGYGERMNQKDKSI